MKSLLFTVLALPIPALSYWKGFNIGANLPSTGACKSTADWEKDFTTMAALAGDFTSARLYAASDCDTLANAVPAALSTGTSLLVGLWAEDEDHYTAEKNALQSAVAQYGSDWIIAVSVGSEDLYRGDTSASTLASQIYDVRGMMGAIGAGGVQVGHVDTWTAWVNSDNDEVITACEWVGVDGYPYYQDASIEDSPATFWESVTATRNAVNAVNPGVWVWITETGEPVSGPTAGAAVPSVSNAQSYWSSVACQAFDEAHTFWYTLQDAGASPSFGVVDANFNPILNLEC
ncbi:hypothetical protein MMC20_007232 [Loxospora ochrophaea]|nr:hypothetical protein [Loxospora ochrophaea]